MKKIGIYGGSFNPPHVGHVLAVQYAYMVGDFDEILIVPCYKHPFEKNLIIFHHRVNMCSIAFKIPKVFVDSIESKLSTPSFTVNTLKALYDKEPAEYKIIVGSDVDSRSWKDSDELLKIASLFVIGRSGYQQDISNDISLPNVSSTQVRHLLKNKDDNVKKLIPKDVFSYIKENNLF